LPFGAIEYALFSFYLNQLFGSFGTGDTSIGGKSKERINRIINCCLRQILIRELDVIAQGEEHADITGHGVQQRLSDILILRGQSGDLLSNDH